MEVDVDALEHRATITSEQVADHPGIIESLGRLHQSNFKPNCTCREVVEVLVIAPAVGETPDGVNTTALGKLKFARFNRLKISARN
jgi:hypothetical protein